MTFTDRMLRTVAQNERKLSNIWLSLALYGTAVVEIPRKITEGNGVRVCDFEAFKLNRARRSAA